MFNLEPLIKQVQAFTQAQKEILQILQEIKQILKEKK